MGCFKPVLNLINFFGVAPPFFIYGKYKMKTRLTMILSLLFIAFTIFLVIFFGRDLFRKDNGVINSFNDFSNDDYINLNINNFFFAFTFKDDVGQAGKDIDLNYLPIHLSYDTDDILNLYGYNEKNNTNISFVKCKEEFIKDFTHIDDKIKEEIISNGYCLNFNNNSLKSSPLYGNYRTVTFRMFYDEELRREQFKKNSSYTFSFPLTFHFYIQNYIYKKDDYNNPFQKNIGYQEGKLEYIDEKKVFSFTFKTGISERDDHFLLTKINKTKYYGFSSSNEIMNYYYNFFYKSCEDGYDDDFSLDMDYNNEHCVRMFELMKLNFYFEPYVEIYRRTYLKVQDILVKIISFIQFGLTVVELTIKLFGRFEVLNKIIDSNYNYSLKSSIKKYIQLNNNGNKTINNVSNLENISNNQLDKSKVKIMRTNNYLIEEKKNNKKITKNIELSMLYNNCELSNSGLKIINSINENDTKIKKKCTCICCNKFKKEREIIISFLDVANLLRLYDEIKGVEMVLFDEEQFILYNYLTNFDKIRKDYSTMLVNKQKDEKDFIEKIKKYYTSKNEKNSINEKDIKLLDIMEINFKNNICKK